MFPFISVTLPSFSVLAFTGGLFAVLFVYFRRVKFGFSAIEFLSLIIFCFIGLVIGAKLLYIISRASWLTSNFTVSVLMRLVFRGGIVFYGGLFGLLFAVEIYAKIKRMDASSIYRMIVPAIPLFHGFGRIGCFLGGCCFGRALEIPVEVGYIYLNRIPVQLFESAFCFVLFAVLLIVEKKRSNCNTLRLYLVSYAIFRFLVEFLRADMVRGVYLLSTSQWISLAIIAYYLFILIYGKTRQKK